MLCAFHVVVFLQLLLASHVRMFVAAACVFGLDVSWAFCKLRGWTEVSNFTSEHVVDVHAFVDVCEF
jgi:hypothetical protein